MNWEKRFFVSFSVHICMFFCACKYEDDDDFREDDHDDHDSHDDGNDMLVMMMLIKCSPVISPP